MIAPGLTTARRSSRAPLLDQVPGRSLGDRLGANVWGEALVVGIRPVVLGQRPLLRALGEADRRDRGGHHDPLDAVVERLAEDPQGSLAGRHDQLVRVLRLLRREGRGDVKDVVAALDDVVPVLVAGQVGLVDGEVVGRIDLRGNRGVDLRLAGRVANGRPDSVAPLDQPDDAPPGEIAGAAGGQDCLAVAFGHWSPVTLVDRRGFANSICTSRRRRSRKPASLIASHASPAV